MRSFRDIQKFSRIENEAETKIGTLPTDNGGEYTSNDFENYLQHGIKHQTIVQYNPQQNGVVERMERLF